MQSQLYLQSTVMNTKPMLVRAIKLAYAGGHPKPTLIAMKLIREGYDHANQHLTLKSVKKMLLIERLRGEHDRAADGLCTTQAEQASAAA